MDCYLITHFILSVALSSIITYPFAMRYVQYVNQPRKRTPEEETLSREAIALPSPIVKAYLNLLNQR